MPLYHEPKIFCSVILLLIFFMPANASVISLTTSATSTTSSPSSIASPLTPLEVFIAGGDAGPLGMNKVSGFYGPGAWAGWFLTVIASWIHLLKRGPGSWSDPTAWTYILGINLAAVDLICQFRFLPESRVKEATGSQSWNRAGEVGAATVMIHWGLFHMVFQSYVLLGLYIDDIIRAPATVIAIGIVLPTCALFTEFWLTAGIDVPALFWASARNEVTKEQPYWMAIAALSGAAIVPAGASFFWLRGIEETVPTLAHSVGQYSPWLRKTIQKTTNLAVNTAIGVSMLAGSAAFAVHQLNFFLCIPFPAMRYVWEAYIVRRASSSRSCYFMPCAPQSISDLDQLTPLFVGLFLLVVTEIAPLLHEALLKRKHRQE